MIVCSDADVMYLKFSVEDGSGELSAVIVVGGGGSRRNTYLVCVNVDGRGVVNARVARVAGRGGAPVEYGSVVVETRDRGVDVAPILERIASIVCDAVASGDSVTRLLHRVSHALSSAPRHLFVYTGNGIFASVDGKAYRLNGCRLAPAAIERILLSPWEDLHSIVVDMCDEVEVSGYIPEESNKSC